MKLEIASIILSLISFAIARFDPEKKWFWVGVIFGVLSAIIAIYTKISSAQKKKEVMIPIAPTKWDVVENDGMATDAELTIRESEHGKGSDISIRIEQTEFKKWDLAEPKIKDGNITIRYAENNFPMNPRIHLHVYISGR